MIKTSNSNLRLPAIGLAVLCFAMSACSESYRNPNAHQPVAHGEIRLTWNEVDPRNAEGDAHSALARGERHLIAIHGFTILVPGVDGAPGNDLLVIEDTGDVIRDEAHRRFQDRAQTYATIYNRVVKLAENTMA